jgi:tetratricopeptide (TPR) repeat protein
MTTMTFAKAMELAFGHFKAGRMADSEGICWQIHKQQPENPEPMYLLSMIALQAGQHAPAHELLAKAQSFQPRNAKYHYAQGVVFQAQGKVDHATAKFNQALALQPIYAEVHNDLGNLLLGKGCIDDALREFQTALAQKPDFFQAMNNLAAVLIKKDRLFEAAEACRAALLLEPHSPQVHYTMGEVLYAGGEYRESLTYFGLAVCLQPNFPQAYINLGNALMKEGFVDAAIDQFSIAASQRPNAPEAYCNLCNAMQLKGQFDEAIEYARKAIAIEPNCFEAYINLGNALIQFERLEEAAQVLAQAVQIAPRSSEAHSNLGNSYFRNGNPRESISHFKRALELWPGYNEARLNLALALLTMGDFAAGWKEYEIRRESPGLLRPDIFAPMWDGSPLGGKRILLHAEQGIGDTIHFARYIPMVRKMGGRVILECQRPMQPLLRGAEGVEECIARGEPLPAIDVHCSLLSLPGVFKTTLETIPVAKAYISADPGKARYWKEKLAALPGKKVGLVWAGGSEHFNDRNRSMPLDALAPLSQIQGISLISLQKGDAAGQSSGPLKLHDWTAELCDFSDTAALIANLDLVISVDTSVAHLAAAMGKPAWVLLAKVADWRWLTARDDSPWYPTVRLFRQEMAKQWQAPVTQAVVALRAFSGN